MVGSGVSRDRNVSRGWCAASTVLAALVITLATPSIARACSCPHPKPFPRDAMRAADAVFEGRVFSQLLIGQHARYGLQVDRYWKGELGERVEIDTQAHGAACGRHFEIGRSYLVYAVRDGLRLADNLCSRTRPSSSAASDLAALGPGQHPAGHAPPEPELADEPDQPPREPPRIEPGPPAPVPSQRGCRVGEGPVPPWLLVLPWLTARGRSTRRRVPAA